MDLMEISDHDLYFDQPLPESVETLIRQASEAYSRAESEYMLLAAYMILPHHLSVHVALYRYYYYKHRLGEALMIAERTIEDSGIALGFLSHWQDATLERLKAKESNMAMVRYYLLALKGSGYICLRIGRRKEGVMRLQKVVEMDTEDRLGVRAILQVVEGYQEEDQ